MSSLRLMTFNVENLLQRFRFRDFEKDDLLSLMEAETEAERAELIRTYWNILNDENRVFTALTIQQANPDVICMQEVENDRILNFFGKRYIDKIYKNNRDPFTYKRLIEGNDPRGIDVAVMSRYEIESISSNRERRGAVPYPDGPREDRIFRRDCLEVNIKKNNKILTVFVCHFKSMSGGRNATKPIREIEASEVKKIIEEKFAQPANEDWVIVGDLNDYTETDGVADDNHGLGALLNNGFSVNIVKNIDNPKDRWTHYYSDDGSYHQLDYILLSPSLAAKNLGIRPEIIRNGQPFRADRYTGDRWPRIGFERPKASDHCPVVADINF
ncbi:MAG: endonuclease/exonuclease/phosphatase family protein [Thaumarchaeota archaeon]|nr:endonuclease/exonuclease/phosphatase family protein [Nitrososphaerota archaeon]